MYRNPRSPIPRISLPEHREMPNVEHLIQPDHIHKDTRPEVVKPYENVVHPQLNRLYGTLRVEDGWQHTIDNYAKGSLTTIANTLVTSNVVMSFTTSETRLSRWPGAVQLYLALRSFSMAPSTATFATPGSIDVYYQDMIGGQVIPIGNGISNAVMFAPGMAVLIPTPITDAGSLNNITVGQIQATLSSGATPGNYIWQLAFSYGYLLPTTKPYDVQHIEDLLDAHPGHAHNAHG